MKEFIKVMKALRDPNRVKIVKMLQHGELCVCEIQEALSTSQSTASKHLHILEEAGLLNSRKEGLWVYYRLDDGSSSPYTAAILGNLKHWMERAPEVAQIAKRLPDIRKVNLCKSRFSKEAKPGMKPPSSEESSSVHIASGIGNIKMEKEELE